MRIKKISYILPLVLLAAASCKNTPKSEPVKIERLDLAVAAIPSGGQQAVKNLRDSMEQGLEALFFIMNRRLDDESLAEYASSRAVQVFTPDIATRLPSLATQESRLGELKSNMATELPDIAFPKLYGVVSPYNKWIFMVDSVMLVGLNHYLGPDYPGYEYFENYQRQAKTADNMVPDVAEALIATNRPLEDPADGSATLLNRMLYEGAVAYAKTKLIPGVDAKRALGYDEESWDWIEKNEANGWDALIQRQMLYSVDPMVADRLLLPAPASSILNPEAPGRIGRYYGYRIVEKFVANNRDKATLDYLLSPDFYNSPSALQESKYTGR